MDWMSILTSREGLYELLGPTAFIFEYNWFIVYRSDFLSSMADYYDD